MLNVKQGSCEYQLLKTFGLTQPGNRTMVSRLRGERSNRLLTRSNLDKVSANKQGPLSTKLPFTSTAVSHSFFLFLHFNNYSLDSCAVDNLASCTRRPGVQIPGRSSLIEVVNSSPRFNIFKPRCLGALSRRWAR